MSEEEAVHRKDIIVGLGVGLGVGLFVLVAVFLLLRPTARPAPTPTATATFAALPPLPVGSEPLILPSPTPTYEPSPTLTPVLYYITYTVKSGDVLSVIAYKFGISVESLMQANNLRGDVIYPDQVLQVPLDENAVARLTATPTTGAVDTTDQLIHKVRPGDTLGGIAQKYGVTVAEIKAANGLTSDLIVVGTSLIIPQPTPTPVPVTPTLTPRPTSTVSRG